jgi:hypothetical protein
MDVVVYEVLESRNSWVLSSSLSTAFPFWGINFGALYSTNTGQSDLYKGLQGSLCSHSSQFQVLFLLLALVLLNIDYATVLHLEFSLYYTGGPRRRASYMSCSSTQLINARIFIHSMSRLSSDVTPPLRY